jgi:hypothetical protein
MDLLSISSHAQNFVCFEGLWPLTRNLGGRFHRMPSGLHHTWQQFPVVIKGKTAAIGGHMRRYYVRRDRLPTTTLECLSSKTPEITG